MPFTLSHAAAALPFRRTRLIPSAVVIGTFAPDFAYFLRLAPHWGYGHTLPGAFFFSLPAALVALWLFHRSIKLPIFLLLPNSWQQRLAPYLSRFAFLPWPRFALVITSAFVGIFTHIAWDSFTHPQLWLYYHWAFLRQSTFVPLVGMLENCRILQHISTVIGLAILAVWCRRWYHSTRPIHDPPHRQLTPAGRTILLVIVPVVAIALSVLRCFIGPGFVWTERSAEDFAIDFVITSIALVWWQFALCGMLIDRPLLSRQQIETSC